MCLYLSNNFILLFVCSTVAYFSWVGSKADCVALAQWQTTQLIILRSRVRILPLIQGKENGRNFFDWDDNEHASLANEYVNYGRNIFIKYVTAILSFWDGASTEIMQSGSKFVRLNQNIRCHNSFQQREDFLKVP